MENISISHFYRKILRNQDSHTCYLKSNKSTIYESQKRTIEIENTTHYQKLQRGGHS